MARATLLAAALAFAAPALSAQQHPLVGTWSISYAAGMRIENGSPTPINATGRLTVELQGDSLIATLATDPIPNLPPRPEVRLAARAGSGDAVFIQRGVATLNINGAEQKATSVSTWTLRAKGDQLEGTLERTIEGVDAHSPGPRPVTGSRLKG